MVKLFPRKPLGVIIVQTHFGEEDMSLENAYAEAEAGWQDLIQAAARIQAAANRIKDGPRSIDGYEIERTLRKHKPEMMKTHLEGLQAHRRENRV